MPIGLNILTNSRLDAFQKCRRFHYNAYELGVRREPSEALRIGTAVHLGTELISKGKAVEEATAAISASYVYEAAQNSDAEFAIHIELVKCQELVIGWANRWAGCGITPLAVERLFRLPIVNPTTHYPAQNFEFAGKIDALVWLEDRRLALLERKTTGESIAPGADYWKRLRLDQQITRYMLAAKAIGHDVQTVLYDVTRKPEIEPRQVPELDQDGIKIVVDANGDRVKLDSGKWRQSGDAAKGWCLQTRTETVIEYCDRLRADIAARPDFYFARVEIPRTQADLEETAQELWDLQKTIREAQITGRHYRNVRSCLSPRCDYLDACHTNTELSRETPEGFMRLDNVHPELGDFYASASAGEVIAATQLETAAATN